MAPDVSVVLATYCNAKCLFDTLASMLAQQQLVLECLIVCDSPLLAGPAQSLRELAERDSPLRFLEHPHGGLTHALIASCSAAYADAIARIDGDDRRQPHRLQRQVEVLRRHPACVLVNSIVCIHGPAWEPLWVARGAPTSAETEPVCLYARAPEHGLAGNVPHHDSVLWG